MDVAISSFKVWLFKALVVTSTLPLVPKTMLKSIWIMSSIDQGWMGAGVKD